MAEIILPEEKEYIRTISVTDRCDRCTARARVKAMKSNLDILFCGHHYHVNKEAIDAWAQVVVDERHLLIEEEKFDDQK